MEPQELEEICEDLGKDYGFPKETVINWHNSIINITEGLISDDEIIVSMLEDLCAERMYIENKKEVKKCSKNRVLTMVDVNISIEESMKKIVFSKISEINYDEKPLVYTKKSETLN